MKPLLRLVAVALLVATAVFASPQSHEPAAAASPETIQPLAVGSAAPDAALTALDGSPTQLAAVLGGKPTILVFFRGGWCPYCQRQLASLQAAQTALRAEGYQLVAISPDSPTNMIKATAEAALTYPLLCDTGMQAIRRYGLAFALDAPTLAKYKGYGITLQPTPDTGASLLPVPAVFLIDAKGNVLYRHFDPDYTQRLDPDKLLAAARTRIELIDYRDGGVRMQGFLAAPKATALARPGVLIVHEW